MSGSMGVLALVLELSWSFVEEEEEEVMMAVSGFISKPGPGEDEAPCARAGSSICELRWVDWLG